MSKKSNTHFWKIFYCFLLAMSAFSTVVAVQIIGFGSRGEKVEEAQSYLYDLNYLKVNPTGYYGRLTVQAVKAFQRAHNLKPDGKIGTKTYDALKEAAWKGTNSQVTSRSRSGQIQAIPWPIVNQLWQLDETVRIIDLRTGKSFMAKRHGGHYHSDTEPLTLKDTQIMLSIYGGRWSWERRAVAVQIRNQFIAASINGKPHGGSSIPDNHFSGHFCVHFLDSRLHLNGRTDPDHQGKIRDAIALALPFTESERQVDIPIESRETR